jgi:hypothetical protein
MVDSSLLLKLIALIAGLALGLGMPAFGDDVVLKCVADGCKARMEGAGNPLTCAQIEFDVIWRARNGACKCPEDVCMVDAADCKSDVFMDIWADPPGSGIGVDVNGDCQLESNFAASSSGAPGCGGQGVVNQVTVTQGLCGGPVLCTFSVQALCRSCDYDC